MVIDIYVYGSDQRQSGLGGRSGVRQSHEGGWLTGFTSCSAGKNEKVEMPVAFLMAIAS